MLLLLFPYVLKCVGNLELSKIWIKSWKICAFYPILLRSNLIWFQLNFSHVKLTIIWSINGKTNFKLGPIEYRLKGRNLERFNLTLSKYSEPKILIYEDQRDCEPAVQYLRWKLQSAIWSRRAFTFSLTYPPLGSFLRTQNCAGLENNVWASLGC